MGSIFLSSSLSVYTGTDVMEGCSASKAGTAVIITRKMVTIIIEK